MDYKVIADKTSLDEERCSSRTEKIRKCIVKDPQLEKYFDLDKRIIFAEEAVRLYKRYLDYDNNRFLPNNCKPLKQEFVVSGKSLGEDDLKVGLANKEKVVKIFLNAGLSSSLGGGALAKAFIPIDGQKTILDRIANNLDREVNPEKIILFNSFATHEKTQEYLRDKITDDKRKYVESMYGFFMPKINRATGAPLFSEETAEDKYKNPIGHADVWRALVYTKKIDELISQGIEYAFVCNGENLGASFDPSVLGYMINNGKAFVSEVVARTPQNMKGGVYVEYNDPETDRNYPTIIESAQQYLELKNVLEDIEKFKYLNTNNTLIELRALKEIMKNPKEKLADLLPIILNPKEVDGVPCFQIEQSSSAIVQHFSPEQIAFVEVEYDRLLPIKNTSDLLLLRSNYAKFTPQGKVQINKNRMVLNSDGEERYLPPPEIKLDDRYYNNIEDFDERVPSDTTKISRKLENVDKLALVGDFHVGCLHPVGKVIIINPHKEQIVLTEAMSFEDGVYVIKWSGSVVTPKRISDFDFNLFQRINTGENNKIIKEFSQNY